jgi:hypothetical protein
MFMRVNSRCAHQVRPPGAPATRAALGGLDSVTRRLFDNRVASDRLTPAASMSTM